MVNMNTKSKTQKTFTLTALDAMPLLNSMTRDELRATASRFGISRGKSASNTKENLLSGITNGTIQFKSIGYLQTAPAASEAHGKTLYCKKLRSYAPDSVVVPILPS